MAGMPEGPGQDGAVRSGRAVGGADGPDHHRVEPGGVVRGQVRGDEDAGLGEGRGSRRAAQQVGRHLRRHRHDIGGPGAQVAVLQGAVLQGDGFRSAVPGGGRVQALVEHHVQGGVAQRRVVQEEQVRLEHVRGVAVGAPGHLGEGAADLGPGPLQGLQQARPFIARIGDGVLGDDRGRDAQVARWAHHHAVAGAEAGEARTGAGRAGGPREGGPREGGPREGGPRKGGPRKGGPRKGGPRKGGPRKGGPREGGPLRAVAEMVLGQGAQGRQGRRGLGARGLEPHRLAPGQPQRGDGVDALGFHRAAPAGEVAHQDVRLGETARGLHEARRGARVQPQPVGHQDARLKRVGAGRRRLELGAEVAGLGGQSSARLLHHPGQVAAHARLHRGGHGAFHQRRAAQRDPLPLPGRQELQGHFRAEHGAAQVHQDHHPVLPVPPGGWPRPPGPGRCPGACPAGPAPPPRQASPRARPFPGPVPAPRRPAWRCGRR